MGKVKEYLSTQYSYSFLDSKKYFNFERIGESYRNNKDFLLQEKYNLLRLLLRVLIREVSSDKYKANIIYLEDNLINSQDNDLTIYHPLQSVKNKIYNISTNELSLLINRWKLNCLNLDLKIKMIITLPNNLTICQEGIIPSYNKSKKLTSHIFSIDGDSDNQIFTEEQTENKLKKIINRSKGIVFTINFGKSWKSAIKPFGNIFNEYNIETFCYHAIDFSKKQNVKLNNKLLHPLYGHIHSGEIKYIENKKAKKLNERIIFTKNNERFKSFDVKINNIFSEFLQNEKKSDTIIIKLPDSDKGKFIYTDKIVDINNINKATYKADSEIAAEIKQYSSELLNKLIFYEKDIIQLLTLYKAKILIELGLSPVFVKKIIKYDEIESLLLKKYIISKIRNKSELQNIKMQSLFEFIADNYCIFYNNLRTKEKIDIQVAVSKFFSMYTPYIDSNTTKQEIMKFNRNNEKIAFFNLKDNKWERAPGISDEYINNLPFYSQRVFLHKNQLLLKDYPFKKEALTNFFMDKHLLNINQYNENIYFSLKKLRELLPKLKYAPVPCIFYNNKEDFFKLKLNLLKKGYSILNTGDTPHYKNISYSDPWNYKIKTTDKKQFTMQGIIQRICNFPMKEIIDEINSPSNAFNESQFYKDKSTSLVYYHSLLYIDEPDIIPDSIKKACLYKN